MQNTTSGDVSIVDPAALNVVGTIPVGLYPDDVVSSPDGRWVYVNRIDSAGIPGAPAVGDTGEVVAISTSTNQIVWRVRTDGMPHHMTVSPDGTKMFVGSMFGDDVTIYDLATQKPVGRIPFASGVRPFAITADQKTMYVQRSRLHGFDVVDIASQKVLRTVDLPALPPGTKLPQFLPHTVARNRALPRASSFSHTGASPTTSSPIRCLT